MMKIFTKLVDPCLKFESFFKCQGSCIIDCILEMIIFIIGDDLIIQFKCRLPRHLWSFGASLCSGPGTPLRSFPCHFSCSMPSSPVSQYGSSLIGWASILRIVHLPHMDMLVITLHFNLEGKQWFRSLHKNTRLDIQNRLDCCGYFSPFASCFAGTILSGSKVPFLEVVGAKLYFGWCRSNFWLGWLHCCDSIGFGKEMMPEAYK